MADALGYRLKVGIIIPSTNTIVQPEMEQLRPEGVTNHICRMPIVVNPMVSAGDVQRLSETLTSGIGAAMESVLTCSPQHLIIGISADNFLNADGSPRQIDAITASKVPVTTSADALRAALKACGPIRRIALITPYGPSANDRVSALFTEAGYEILAIEGMEAASPALISHISEDQLRDAIKNVDSPRAEAIVQVGTSLAMSRIAPQAEAWLGKPVISNNAALYWHALRHHGIRDPLAGSGVLFSSH